MKKVKRIPFEYPPLPAKTMVKGMTDLGLKEWEVTNIVKNARALINPYRYFTGLRGVIEYLWRRKCKYNIKEIFGVDFWKVKKFLILWENDLRRERDEKMGSNRRQSKTH